MSLLAALSRHRDPVEERSLSPEQLAWARGDDVFSTFSPAGVPVTRDTMLGVSAVWACVSLIADSIATLPLGVYRTVNGAPKPTTTPAWLDEPNPEQTLVDFIFGTVASLLLHGNAYIYTVRNAKQDIVEAWLLDPRWVYVRREQQAKSGLLGLNYYVSVGKGMQSPVGPFKVSAGPDMFHIMAFQPSSSWPMGVSPIDTARMMWGGSIAGQEMGTRWFSQGMNAAGVIEHPEEMTIDQARQLKTDFKDANTGGPSKMHLPPVLTGGATWKQIQISPEQAQFLEQRKFAVDEIARWFRVPPHMIGNLEKTSSWGAGIEQQSIGFVTYTLRPWLDRIQKSWTRYMLPFQTSSYFRFDTTDLMRGDMAAVADFAVKMHMVGGMNSDEIRTKYLGLPPQPDGDGEVFYFPVNTAPVGDQPVKLDQPKVDITGAPLTPVGDGGTAKEATPAPARMMRGKVTLDVEMPQPDLSGVADEVAARIEPGFKETQARVDQAASKTAKAVEDVRADAVQAADEAREEAVRVADEVRGEIVRLSAKSRADLADLETRLRDQAALEKREAEKPQLRTVTLSDGRTGKLLIDGAKRILELEDGRRFEIDPL